MIALAGPAAEELFAAPITDHGDFLDLTLVVKSYLEQGYPQFQHGWQLARLKSAASIRPAPLEAYGSVHIIGGQSPR